MANKNDILKFVLIFYLFYFIMCLVGNIFIDYNDISIYTILIVITYITSISVGIILGYKSNKKYDENENVEKRILVVLVVINTLSILISWYITINHFSSVEYIYYNALTIRNNSIGQSAGVLPTYIGYINSILWVTFPLALSYLSKHNNFWNKILIAYIFVLVALGDLLNFGRIGMLYCIFMIVGYMYMNHKKMISMKNILVASLLMILFSLPRLIRGSFDNFSSTVDTYAKYMNVDFDPIFNPLISMYIYYFSSPYALDYFLYNNSDFTYGNRTFAPIVNFAYRLLDMDNHVSLIDDFSAIPFQYNIYTIIRDFYGDFGPVGLLLLTLIVGIYLGKIFSMSGFYHDALKIFMIGWIMYTPVYNPLIFGGFFIAFIVLNIFALLERYGKYD